MLFVLLQNILENVYNLSKENIVLSSDIGECELEREESKMIVQQFSGLTISQIEEMTLTPELGKKISLWWNDSGIKATFERKKIHDPQNMRYFFERVNVISEKSYRATWEDYVCKTTIHTYCLYDKNM